MSNFARQFLRWQTPPTDGWFVRGLGLVGAKLPGRPISAASLKRRSRSAIQRVVRQALVGLSERWPGWDRAVNPRQRQIVTVVSRPGGQGSGIGGGDPKALVRQLKSPEWHVRARAASKLAGASGDAAGGVTDALIAALHDPSAEVALAVIDALADCRNVRTTAALRDVFVNAEGFFSPLARAAAVAVLADRLPVAELAPVFDAVGDVDSEVSLAAIEALASCAPGRACEKLLPVLLDETGYFLPPVRHAAALALRGSNGLSGTQRAQLLVAESDPGVRGVLASTWES